MPGSLTTPGRPGARDDAPGCVAFRHLHGVGTQNRNLSRLNGWPLAVWPRRKLPSSCQELRRQLFQFLQPSQHRVAAASSLSTGGKYGLIQDHS